MFKSISVTLHPLKQVVTSSDLRLYPDLSRWVIPVWGSYPFPTLVTTLSNFRVWSCSNGPTWVQSWLCTRPAENPTRDFTAGQRSNFENDDLSETLTNISRQTHPTHRFSAPVSPPGPQALPAGPQPACRPPAPAGTDRRPCLLEDSETWISRAKKSGFYTCLDRISRPDEERFCLNKSNKGVLPIQAHRYLLMFHKKFTRS